MGEDSLTPYESVAVDLWNCETDQQTMSLLAGGMDKERGPSCTLIPHVLHVQPASASSQVSAASTTDSHGLGFDISRSVSRSLTGGTSSPHDGPECPSTMTSETWVINADADRDGMAINSERDAGLGIQRSDTMYTLKEKPHMVGLISSAGGSPAKTCPSPDNAAASTATGPGCSSSSPGSPSLFDPDGYSSRTYPVSSLRTAVGTSEQSLERWPTSGTAWPGGFSTHVSSECRSDADGCSSSEPSLTVILEPPLNVPAKYSLSGRAARGILRRAEKRGRELPSHLRTALMAVASLTGSPPIAPGEET